MKAKFISPAELLAKQKRDYLRALRRSVKGRGAVAHATGVGFVDGLDTTPAVRHRMRNMEYYLRNEMPPMWTGEDALRNAFGRKS